MGCNRIFGEIPSPSNSSVTTKPLGHDGSRGLYCVSRALSRKFGHRIIFLTGTNRSILPPQHIRTQFQGPEPLMAYRRSPRGRVEGKPHLWIGEKRSARRYRWMWHSAPDQASGKTFFTSVWPLCNNRSCTAWSSTGTPSFGCVEIFDMMSHISCPSACMMLIRRRKDKDARCFADVLFTVSAVSIYTSRSTCSAACSREPLLDIVQSQIKGFPDAGGPTRQMIPGCPIFPTRTIRSSVTAACRMDRSSS